MPEKYFIRSPEKDAIRLRFFLVVLGLVLSFPLFAHNINVAMERAPANQVAWFYFKLGVYHIIPSGIDHILFVVAVCLLNNRLSTICWQATAFTLAHSVTLALSTKGVITLPSPIVEPLIALSIVFVAIENILFNELKAWRILVVFMFGLIHGLGFASALNEIGLPHNQFFVSILSFNVGVEAGQVIVILFVFLTIIRTWGKKSWYKKRVVFPISALIALVALFWTIQRIVQN